MVRKVMNFFDKLEDKTRARLSRLPILYAFLGGIGIVLFWRGIWHLADEMNLSSIGSVAGGSLILLLTGVFVSSFVGNRLIITGLSGEKKLTEKTKEEIDIEVSQIKKMQETLDRVEEELTEIEKDLHAK